MLTRLLASLTLIALISGTIEVPVSAQTPAHSLVGVVNDAKGAPVADATVIATGPGSDATQTGAV